MTHAVSAAAHHTTAATDAVVTAHRRLVLVQVGNRPDELVRRYRLARLRLDGREQRDGERFGYLKRNYD